MDPRAVVRLMVRCLACEWPSIVAFASAFPARAELLASSCCFCGKVGQLRLAPRLPMPSAPTAVNKYEWPPDELDDEELLEHRARMKRFP